MKLSGGVRTEGKLDTHDIDVAKLVEPEVVHSGGGSHEVANLELAVDLGRGRVQLVQNPTFYQALPTSGLYNHK